MPLSRKDFLKLSSLTTLGVTGKALSGFNEDTVHHTLIKPSKLPEGATIGLIAPGSPIYSSSQYDKMLSDLKGLGYTLKLGKHIKDKRGYLAGKDEDRAQDLMDMFVDESVDGILCTRGGWGCNRILPLIDFELIKSNPKVFSGFSDITSLHMAIQKKTGLVTFHGPVGKSEWNEFTLNSWQNVVQHGKAVDYVLPEGEEGQFTINSGKAKGRLLGGNLTVLTSMIGSEYLPDFEDSILFLEDIGEDVYRIDRMLTQLKLSGILEKLNGLVFGKCTECDSGPNSLSLKEVFDDHLSKLDIPAFYGAMISHEEKNVTIPIGVSATMNADTMTIQLQESGVK
ncbi:MAG: LD-carboxypeptidase [Balneolaceae bacterium]